jgi:hypothetical protein
MRMLSCRTAAFAFLVQGVSRAKVESVDASSDFLALHV